MDNRERMKLGKLYDPCDPEILQEQQKYMKQMYLFNQTGPEDGEKRQTLLREMLGSVGKNCHIEPPFFANWGGKHLYLGSYVYANFHLTLADDGNIYVGDYVMFGPNVTITTAGHPIEPHLRKKGYQYNADIHIGNNVWICAGVTILPGVTIGDDTVIGAGSVVTKDIPGGVVAVGAPCRPIREIGEKDRKYYFRDWEVDMEIPED